MNETLTVAESYAARALTYRFLAQLYRQEPDPAWLGALAAQGLLDEFPVAPDNPDMATGLGLVREACRCLALDPAGAEAAAVREEYTSLFLGAAHLPAPPWESVYRSDERTLCDWPTLAVRDAYRRSGLMTAWDGEPDDHIGLELLFLGVLCERAAEGDAEAEGALCSFLKEHLLQWAPAFTADLAAAATTGLYCGLAKLTAGYLALESEA